MFEISNDTVIVMATILNQYMPIKSTERWPTAWCKKYGIRLSGVPLGRPPKDQEKNRARRRQIREDEGIRNAVEGKFGQAKRRYSLNRVMARLAESSQTVVSIVFLVMNLEHLLSVSFLRIYLVLKHSQEESIRFLDRLVRQYQQEGKMELMPTAVTYSMAV